MKRNVRMPNGYAVNFDHIVMVVRRDGIQFARLVSGSTVALKDVYPLAHDLFRVSKDGWVNPDHVSVVDVGYNKSAAYQDAMADRDKATKDYMQVRVETVLGSNHTVWADLYGVDEVAYLVELMEGWSYSG